MLSPFQGGAPRKPVAVELDASGQARVLFKSGKPAVVPAAIGDGALSGLERVSPRRVVARFANGSDVPVGLKGGGSWRLDDPGIDLSDPLLRLDGTLNPTTP